MPKRATKAAKKSSTTGARMIMGNPSDRAVRSVMKGGYGYLKGEKSAWAKATYKKSLKSKKKSGRGK